MPPIRSRQRYRARIIFLVALVGLVGVAYRVAEHDPWDAVAVVGIGAILVLAAMLEWPELDRMWRGARSDDEAVERLHAVIDADVPPPRSDLL